LKEKLSEELGGGIFLSKICVILINMIYINFKYQIAKHEDRDAVIDLGFNKKGVTKADNIIMVKTL